MRRLLLLLMIVGALLLPFGVAYATPPTLSSGTYGGSAVETTIIRFPDGNMVLTIKREGRLSGTTEGLFTETAYIVGKRISTFHGIQICSPCTVGGRSGTYVARFEGTSEDGHDRGQWVYLSGTGDLANLRGHGTLEGISAPDGSTSGTYSGEYHFDP
jgi:hypothetical protein